VEKEVLLRFSAENGGMGGCDAEMDAERGCPYFRSRKFYRSKKWGKRRGKKFFNEYRRREEGGTNGHPKRSNGLGVGFQMQKVNMVKGGGSVARNMNKKEKVPLWKKEGSGRARLKDFWMLHYAL